MNIYKHHAKYDKFTMPVVNELSGGVEGLSNLAV